MYCFLEYIYIYLIDDRRLYYEFVLGELFLLGGLLGDYVVSDLYW